MAESDILNDLLRLRHAFRAAHMKPPVAIHLESHDDGMAFICTVEKTKALILIPPDKRFGTPIEMADGTVYMEVEAVGFKIRWPAQRYAKADGSWCFT